MSHKQPSNNSNEKNPDCSSRCDGEDSETSKKAGEVFPGANTSSISRKSNGGNSGDRSRDKKNEKMEEDDWSDKPTKNWCYETNTPVVMEKQRVFVDEMDASRKNKLVLISTKRGIRGLAPLPHRLNTFDRVFRDSELRRIFFGKHKIRYKFIPYKKKSEGAAVGTIYRKIHSCSKKIQSKKLKLWLGKVGANESHRFRGHSFTFRGDNALKNKRGYNLSVMLEYIANCLYRVFGDGTFETPKNRLSVQNVSDEFCKDSLEVKYIINTFKVKWCLRVMSKWCDEYHDIGKLLVKKENGVVVGFMEFVASERTVPTKVIDPAILKEKETWEVLGEEYKKTKPRVRLDNGEMMDLLVFMQKNMLGWMNVEEHKENVKIIRTLSLLKVKLNKFEVVGIVDYVRRKGEIPEMVVDPACLKQPKQVEVNGLLGLLASSTSIGDADVLGYTGANAGFVVHQDAHDNVISIRIVKVDPGFSFDFKFIRPDSLGDKRDIVFSPKSFTEIEWKRLTQKQKYEFLEVKIHHLEIIKDRKILEYIFSREGMFKQNNDNSIRMPLVSAKAIMDEITTHIQRDGKIYEGDIEEYRQKREKFLARNHEFCRINGDYDRALSNVEKLLELYERKATSSVETHEMIGLCYKRIAQMEWRRGNLERSLTFCKKQLETKVDLPSCFHNFGNVYSGQGDFEKAIQCFNKALSCSERITQNMQMTIRDVNLGQNTNQLTIATSYNNLGSAHDKRGEYEKALLFYNKALAIRLRFLPETHPIIANNYNNMGLGYVYYSQGDIGKAIHFFERANEIYSKTLPENHPELAAGYNHLGCMYKCQKKIKKAIGYFEKALLIQFKSLPENHSNTALTYLNLGTLYFEGNANFPKAIECLEKCLDIQLKSLPENHPEIGITYNNFGSIYSAKGDFEKSIAFHNKALTIQRNSLPKNHPSIATTYSNLADANHNPRSPNYQRR